MFSIILGFPGSVFLSLKVCMMVWGLHTYLCETHTVSQCPEWGAEGWCLAPELLSLVTVGALHSPTCVRMCVISPLPSATGTPWL